MKTHYLLIISLLVGLFFSCEKAVLGEDESNDPINNFEILWNDMNVHYALFDVKGIDWDAIYDEYRPLVSHETTNDELWEVLTGMLEHLNDGHVLLIQPDPNGEDRFFESGSALGDLALEEFDLDLIKANYVENYKVTEYEEISYGKIKDKDIGYIHLFGVEGDNPDLVDDLLADLKDHKAIIVDARNNGGGFDDYAHRFAGPFADGEHFIYTVQTKNGPGHSDFDEKTFWYTEPEGEERFLKPVIFLTDRFTASAAEILTFNMRAFSHVTHMGDTTAGDHSDISSLRFLPNGWLYSWSPQLYLTPEGDCLEGIGIAPEIYIKNTVADIEAGEDKVLEKAIDYLFEEYGIE